MKENKNVSVGVRLTTAQEEILQSIVESGKAKTISSAIQYLIQQYAILGK
ncbi:TPA: hypothetical protein ACK2W9_005450 [Klebsiella michiganensis]|jgi:Arc/MetJ-type ribon-helix-helix transcriptional regulator|nr:MULTISPECIES: hypothetical protein [Klebsiella/Raoultella group]MDU4226382.1 hypothetical protein [Klebsiella grimontii]EJG2382741.1 hypothetical protein [Raoultella ornithinolytica]ELB6486364.1 hypothetical protein [Raoultella ornithinolytica]ELB7348245.1 hypothetical protein [Klebsiella michiganensis]ELC2237096.1 hypothetical protein [Klebsiella michiganensis]